MPKRYKQTKLNFAKKTMTAIAKKVVQGEAETKSTVNNVVTTLTGDAVYALNLLYVLQQGTTAEALIGEKFHLKNIYSRINYVQANSATASTGDSFLRVMMVRTKKPLTASGSLITATDVFRGATSRYASLGFVDLHKVDLVYDKTFHIPVCELVNQDNSKYITINKKINKTLTFDLDNSAYVKDKNYYLIYTAHKADNNGNGIGTFRFQWSLNFKDN